MLCTEVMSEFRHALKAGKTLDPTQAAKRELTTIAFAL